MTALRRIDTRIPRRPLLWLAVALLFTVPPMLGDLVSWVPALFVLTLAAKFWMESKGYRLRLALWKLILAGLALAAIYLSYGTLSGIEPGVSLTIVLMSLKILEAHTAREFQVLVMLSWILCLCGFFLSQDLVIALCLLLAFILILVALLQFQRGSSPGVFWPPLRTAGKLLLQAVPVIALLFLFFPRVSTGFRVLMMPSLSGAVGFSDRLSPGSIAALASSDEVAFRAEFPDGRTRGTDALYWRGIVMWEGDGMRWHAPRRPIAIPPSAASSPIQEETRQRITLQPHGEHWMFALDWPNEAPRGATLAAGNYLSSNEWIRKARRYEVSSSARLPTTELKPFERELLLEVPDSLSPRVRELTASWVAPNPDPKSVVSSALRFFRKGFRYSLSPGPYTKDALDEFLFDRRVGFCEHYAASFATLMRVAGIPARVVVGYLGGEYNEVGEFFVVRQSDAHAWCEVWLPESGWTRVDPTSVVAPERMNFGIESFLESRGASTETSNRTFATQLARQPIFTTLRFAWQALNYAWDTRVLSFDAEAQKAFASSLDVDRVPRRTRMLFPLCTAAAIVAFWVGWARFRRTSTAGRVKALHEKFCRKAARKGVVRAPWEGPSDFAERAASFLPGERERVRRIRDGYLALRYSEHPPSTAFAKLAQDVRAFASRLR